jgi:methylated-DNA-[protein]-cysteine S-methyltransferase
MDAPGLALFDTALGACALAWTQQGLLAVQLPEADPAATRARLLKRLPEAVDFDPTAEAREAIDAMVGLLDGQPRELSFIRLHIEDAPAFVRRVYQVARAIPPGSTLTYGEVAARAGDPGAAQAVGQIMGRNPWPIVVPCHRVVAAGGRLGGFSAHGGGRTKLRLLEIERAFGPETLPLFAAASGGH